MAHAVVSVLASLTPLQGNFGIRKLFSCLEGNFFFYSGTLKMYVFAGQIMVKKKL